MSLANFVHLLERPMLLFQNLLQKQAHYSPFEALLTLLHTVHR